jgi:hypothetical protein
MTTKTTVFDIIEAAHSFRKVRGAVEHTEKNAGYCAVAFRVPYGDKVLVRRDDGTLPRVHVIGIGYGVIAQVRFDSNNCAIYDIVLDEPIVTAIDQTRDYVARREELEEVQA